jgi:hypothetical protein
MAKAAQQNKLTTALWIKKDAVTEPLTQLVWLSESPGIKHIDYYGYMEKKW